MRQRDAEACCRWPAQGGRPDWPALHWRRTLAVSCGRCWRCCSTIPRAG